MRSRDWAPPPMQLRSSESQGRMSFQSPRGVPSHNEYIAAEVFKGIAQVAMEANLPVVLGVITADNLEQAIDRAGAKSGNKGFEAAMSAVEMINLCREL